MQAAEVAHLQPAAQGAGAGVPGAGRWAGVGAGEAAAAALPRPWPRVPAGRPLPEAREAGVRVVAGRAAGAVPAGALSRAGERAEPRPAEVTPSPHPRPALRLDARRLD